jgi:hypothetical protein
MAMPPPALSVVERLKSASLPCGRKGCSGDGSEPALVPHGGVTLICMLCPSCVEELAPTGVRPVPIAKKV